MSGSNTIGKAFAITIFGESHGKGIGVVIDGVPAGLKFNNEEIIFDLNRRRPGQSKISTPRNEKDQFTILSGVKDGFCTGAPLTLFIENQDQRSKDYSKFRDTPRPSQIDYPAILRYGNHVDLRGSGIFSGRLTAPIVMAGAIAKQILFLNGVKIAAFVKQIGYIRDDGKYSVEEIKSKVEKNIVRTVDPKIAQDMIILIEKVRDEEDSIGGIVEVVVENYPKGLGNPWFESLESRLSSAIFSIPAVRGVEFGKGFGSVKMRGSEHNDPYILNKKTNEISTKSNNCGGIIGGISIGTPIIFRAAIKPTASIGIAQKTLNIKKSHVEDLIIEGRHDPCIVPRALVGIEAITAIVLADFILRKNY